MNGSNTSPETGTIRWECLSFAQLDATLLYRIIQLRMEVFVVEQTCYYQDLDDKDQKGLHLVGMEGDLVVAYARLLPQGVSYPDAVSIGRVITAASHRRTGLGKELMKRAIDRCSKEWQGQPIRISAQTYLDDFYSSFGFVQNGVGYLEDGIPHIPMIRRPE